MLGADLVARSLAAHGVSFIATLCGNGIDPVLYACRAAGMRIVDTHNEQTASYMAESYARLTRQIGVCAVSSSVGFTNALIGAVNAWFDGAPMLLIAGASDYAYAGRGNFQDFDQVTAARPIWKYAQVVETAEKIAFHVHAAIAAAVSGRPGPVHLTIPMNVLNAEVQESPLPPGLHGAGKVQPLGAGDARQIEQAASAIGAAQRPLLVAGSGVFYAQGADALARFVGQTAMPVVTPIWDRGSVGTPLPQFMGVIGAASGSPPLLADADLIILAGARVDYRVGYMQPPAVAASAQVVRISADPLELRQGVEAAVAIQGDVRSALDQLSDRLPQKPSPAHSAWLAEAQRRNRRFRQHWTTPVDMTAARSTGRHIVEALRPFAQQDAALVVDGGNIGQWVHMAMCERYPGHWLTCGASGVVGFGLGGAMATRLAFPDRPVILLSGDGSIGFNTMDLESAARQHLPFVVMVADDQAWGIVVSGQSQRWGVEHMVGCQLGPVRFEQIAEACGALGLRADRPQDIAPAIARGLAADRPCLIHVPIEHGGPADV
jgi:acetolactate synthase-1/2/3 large subunit